MDRSTVTVSSPDHKKRVDDRLGPRSPPVTRDIRRKSYRRFHGKRNVHLIPIPVRKQHPSPNSEKKRRENPEATFQRQHVPWNPSIVIVRQGAWCRENVIENEKRYLSLGRLFLFGISLCDVPISTSCSTLANAHRLISTYIVACLFIFITLLVLSSLCLVWGSLLLVECLPALTENLANLAY